MMDGETAFLQIGLRTPKRYRMVSILIPHDVWSKLGGKADPFVGKTVDVDGTPQLVQGTYINIPIMNASQLRIVP